MIVIRLVSVAGDAPAAKLEGRFGAAGGDIGRGSDCTLVLPDPERRVSRKHLQVAWRDGRATLRLISANLLVELDGVPMVPGTEAPLEHGARIRVGHFELLAELAAEARAAAPPPRAAPAPAPVPPSAFAADDSMALLRPPPTGPSVFRDLLRPDAPPPPAPGTARPPPAVAEVDLLVGEPTGAGARPPPLQAELASALLRDCVGGVLGLLAARAIAKRELGAAATQLQLRENNPLKFAPDPDAALALLLAPTQRGFLAPRDAVRDAFDDLRAHEVALLEGMRAALGAVLDRFDPAALEARLADQGLWDSLLPANRRARLWERYAEQHAAIAREIEEHFDAIFAGAFAKAYEAQRAALRKDPHAP